MQRHDSVRISGSRADANGGWRLALTEMVLSGCQLQKLGKESCAEGRRAFWERLGDLRILGKIFAAWSFALLRTTTRRAAALRNLRLAREFVARVTTGERRRLRKEVGRLCRAPMVRKDDRGESSFASRDRVIIIHSKLVANHVSPLIDWLAHVRRLPD